VLKNNPYFYMHVNPFEKEPPFDLPHSLIVTDLLS